MFVPGVEREHRKNFFSEKHDSSLEILWLYISFVEISLSENRRISSRKLFNYAKVERFLHVFEFSSVYVSQRY